MSTSLPRITARVSADTQELLSKAAAIVGISSINSFVLNAAIEKANKILEQEQTIKLSEQDTRKLLDALDKPGRVHSRLKQAARRYKDTSD